MSRKSRGRTRKAPDQTNVRRPDADDKASQVESINNTLKGLLFLVPAIPVAVALFRVVQISNGDSATLRVLISTLDTQAAFLWAITPVLPHILLGIGGYVVIKSHRAQDSLGVPGIVFSAALLTCAITTLYIAIFQLAIAVALIGGFGFINVLSGRRQSRKSTNIVADIRSQYFVYPILVGPIVAALLSGSTMWLPSERLQDVDEDKKTGYVLDVDGDQMMILYKGRTDIIRIPQSRITERTICREYQPQWWSHSLIVLISGQEQNTPVC